MSVRKIKQAVLATVAFAAVILQFVPVAALAAPSTPYTWLDSRSMVDGSGHNYNSLPADDGEIGVPLFKWKNADGCTSIITAQQNAAKGNFYESAKSTDPNNKQCQYANNGVFGSNSQPVWSDNQSVGIALAHAERYNIVFDWVDKALIQKINSSNKFVLDPASKQYRLQGDTDKCIDYITLKNSAVNVWDAYLHTQTPNGSSCKDDRTSILLGFTANASKTAGTGSLNDPGGTGTATAADATCEVGSFSWLVCPLISVGQKTVGYLEGIVADQLQFQPLTNDTDAGLKPAWVVFRNLADVFFVLIFFIVIFGTSLGLDNYTVKKVLPRLIAAAVLIQFSYILVGVMVDISNVLGIGINSLLASAVPAGIQTGNSPVTVGAGVVEAITIVVAAVAFNAYFALGLAIPLLLVLFSGILGILAVLVTLQIRMIIIDVLIVLSPVAILLWVLPNTEKYFNMWRETLIKLLLMFPIIALLFGVTNLISLIMAHGGTQVSDSQKLLTSILPIIAFFMVPATFKFAGSAMMAGSSFVGKHASRGKNGISGAQDKMKQNRAYNRQQHGLATLNAQKNGEAPNTKLGRGIAKLPGGKGLQGRLAQHQAGLSLDKIQPNRIAGALEKNDKDQLAAATRRQENDSPDTLKKTALDSKSDQFSRRSAIGKLAAIEDTAALEEVLASSYGNNNKNAEWIKATSGNYSGLKKKAPHLVAGNNDAALGNTSNTFDSLTTERGVSLDAVGARAMVARRTALAGAHSTATGQEKIDAKTRLDSFDDNVRNVMTGINTSTAGVTSITNATRDELNNNLGEAVGMTILTPVQKNAQASTSVSLQGGGSAQNAQFSPNTTLDPNLVQQRSGVTSWGNSAEGLIIPSSALSPAAAPSRPSNSQPSVSSTSVNARITTVASADDSGGPTSVPASDFVPSRTVNPTQAQAVVQPTITTTATTYGGDSKNPANVFLPPAARVPQPGSRTAPPKPSLRLAPRDLTEEPGDDRSIS